MNSLPADYIEHGVSDDSSVSDDSTIERSAIRDNSTVEKESSVYDSNILDHTIIRGSKLAKGCNISYHSVIENSQINNTVVQGLTSIKDSFIQGRTMMMNGSSRFTDLMVLNRVGGVTTDFHVRGDVIATSLSVAGHVIISNEKKDSPLIIPDGSVLAHGSIVRSSNDILLVRIPLVIKDNSSGWNMTEYVTLTGCPSKHYGYAVNINHNGDIVAMKSKDLERILLSVYGSESKNRDYVQSVQKMFTQFADAYER